MLEITGFNGYTYNTPEVGSLDHVITPPYDVIGPIERAHLAASSPYNLTHLILPEGDGTRSKYDVAGALFNEWVTKNVFVRDDTPCYYLLRQTFTDLKGQRRVRRGFFGLVRLPEAGSRDILGHERTFAKPVEDRLQLLEATRAQFGAIFGLYADPDGVLGNFLDETERRPADAAANTCDGVLQEFWRVPNDPAVAEFLRDKRIYIADGHHRYQTAGTFRDQLRAQGMTDPNAPHQFVMMGFVAIEDPGLAIYAPHRAVRAPEGFDATEFLKNLGPWFDVAPVEGDLIEAVESDPAQCAIGLAMTGSGQYVLRLREEQREKLLGLDRGPSWRDLDVAVLHRGILEHILGLPEGAEFIYEKSAAGAFETLKSGAATMAFLLRPTRADQIRACAEAGEPMPQKSTYFFPKLPSGAVVHRLV